MGPTWGPPGPCRPQMGLILVPWTLLSGTPYVLGLIFLYKDILPIAAHILGSDFSRQSYIDTFLSCQLSETTSNHFVFNFYASAFRRRRHYVFGLSVRPSVRLSVRPSVRPKPEIPSFDLYIGPLVHPTNRYRFTACPSVRLSVRPSVRPSVRRGFRAFARECMEGLGWNFTCWCILTIFRTD